MKKKNILILYAKMGKGHLSASMATKEALELLYGDKVNVMVVDFFQLLSQGFSNTTQKMYDGSVKFIPSFYKAFFELSDSIWSIKFLNAISYISLQKAMKKLLKETDPDILVSTFPIWDYGVAQFWKKKHPDSKFVNIITDSISIHKAWLIADSDYRIVPNEDTAKVLMHEGVPAEKIKILGFPVSLDFIKEVNNKTILKNLGLNPNLYTVLLFATMGENKRNLRIFEKIINEKRDYNVIGVMGRNKSLLPKIEHLKNQKNVTILEWTDNVPDLMKASDLIITKAGGATIMECIAAKKPMIITHVIPGQEEGNAILIEKHNLGIILKKGRKGIDEIPSHISTIRKESQKYAAALKEQSNPRAALKIAEFINSLL
jgi:UDP-N-acetylglucosamine:LPS N-acetylglucosamine transferase